MKKVKVLFVLLMIIMISGQASAQHINLRFKGAWQSDNGVILFSGNFFSYALFDVDSKEFVGTFGGAWSANNNTLIQDLEYNTFDNTFVGQRISKNYRIEGNKMIIDDEAFNRIDDGSPGKLEGAWLFSGRKQDGEIQTRDTNQPRKTMKILSGKRFQWIAYNVETGVFSGTGGGTYTTSGDQYTENIDFFSRDNSRVGASLSFDYEITDGVWHHSGMNSRGEPMYELWNPRK
jgi:hypothetical protein